MTGAFPQFFFTASFLQKYARVHQEALLSGDETIHLDAFKHFLLNSNGSVLLDQKLDLEPFPTLKRVFGTDAPQYTVYETSETKNTEDVELEAFSKHDASFSEKFTEQKLHALETQLQVPVFNVSRVQSRWYKIAGHDVGTMNAGDKFNWKDFLEAFMVPTSQIIFCDPFLTQKPSNVKNNFIPILQALKTLVNFTGNIILISTQSVTGNVEKFLRERLEDSIKIEYVLVESTSIKIEHDRRMITDTLLLNIPSGFNAINDRGVVSQSTEPNLISVFSGNSSHVRIHQKRKSYLLKESDRIKSRRVATT